MLRSTVRAVLSLLPPGADPTTISTFFCGDHVCAAAMVPAHAVTSAKVIVSAFKQCSSLLGHVRGPPRLGRDRREEVLFRAVAELDAPRDRALLFVAVDADAVAE